ncbi:MAG: DUF1475 family protein [Hyphomonadaceae bacterium]|nr:DUF1475 family protein [Hyphomonadaceae bacterium]MCA8886839.1 DUF1475 family protein [Hyphomonadaceae bacterium]
MNILRAVIGILGLALLGLVIWAAVAMQDLHGSFMDQVGVVATLPWGIAALSDLYVGFVFFSVIVFLTERSWVVAALWAVPIFIVGNIWSAVWLVIRLPHLAKQLSKPDWPTS